MAFIGLAVAEVARPPAKATVVRKHGAEAILAAATVAHVKAVPHVKEVASLKAAATTAPVQRAAAHKAVDAAVHTLKSSPSRLRSKTGTPVVKGPAAGTVAVKLEKVDVQALAKKATKTKAEKLSAGNSTSKVARPAPAGKATLTKASAAAKPTLAAHNESKHPALHIVGVPTMPNKTSGTGVFNVPPPAALRPLKLHLVKGSPNAVHFPHFAPDPDECTCAFTDTCSCVAALEFVDCVSAACSSGRCDCTPDQYIESCHDMSRSCKELDFKCTKEGVECAANTTVNEDYKKVAAWEPHIEEPEPLEARETVEDILQDLEGMKEKKCELEMSIRYRWLNADNRLRKLKVAIADRMKDLLKKGHKLPEMHCEKDFEEWWSPAESEGALTAPREEKSTPKEEEKPTPKEEEEEEKAKPKLELPKVRKPAWMGAARHHATVGVAALATSLVVGLLA